MEEVVLSSALGNINLLKFKIVIVAIFYYFKISKFYIIISTFPTLINIPKLDTNPLTHLNQGQETL